MQQSFVDLYPEMFLECFFASYLVRYPFAGNSKDDTNPETYRRDLRRALECTHIQANHQTEHTLIVIDNDTSDAQWVWEYSDLDLKPTWTPLNPHTGTGHLVYALDESINLFDINQARQRNDLARVEHGLTDVLRGDRAYSGFLTKNPLHQAHTTDWGLTVYSLGDLKRALNRLGKLPKARQPHKNVPLAPTGRNCSCFDLLRGWAYREIRKYWDRPQLDWRLAVEEQARRLNQTIIPSSFQAGALPGSEVACTARSVAKWTWAEFTPWRYENGHTYIDAEGNPRRWMGRAISAENGRKSGQVRAAKSASLHEAIREVI